MKNYMGNYMIIICLLYYLHDISSQNFLERLPLIFVRREPKGGYYHITFVEPAR